MSGLAPLDARLEAGLRIGARLSRGGGLSAPGRVVVLHVSATPADLLRPPREFADPPALEDAALGLDAYGQPHDLLSELLRSVRLSGERIVAYAPLRTFSISFADIGTLHVIEQGELVLGSTATRTSSA